MTAEAPLPFTFEDAERLYGEIMSGVIEIIAALSSDVDDDRVSELYRSIDVAARDIYAYATPPKR